jgi:hypothetical protein
LDHAAVLLEEPDRVQSPAHRRLRQLADLPDVFDAPLLYAGAGAAVLLWQYARRQTAVARGALLLFAAAAFASIALPRGASAPPPYPDRYPDIAVRFDALRGRMGSRGVSGIPNRVQLDLPLELAGWSPDLLRSDLAYVALEPERGAVWKSGRNQYADTENRFGSEWLELHLSTQDFERFRGQAVTMHAVIRVTVYRTASRSKVRAGAGWTQIPGFGSILLQSQPQWTNLWWRRPLLQGAERFVSTIQGVDSAVFKAREWGGPGGAEVFHFSPTVCFAAPFERPLASSGEVVLPRAVEADVVVDSPAAVILRDLRIPNIRIADWLSQD